MEKYTIIDNDDIDKYLNDDEIIELTKILIKIADGRRNDGKEPYFTYKREDEENSGYQTG